MNIRESRIAQQPQVRARARPHIQDRRVLGKVQPEDLLAEQIPAPPEPPVIQLDFGFDLEDFCVHARVLTRMPRSGDLHTLVPHATGTDRDTPRAYPQKRPVGSNRDLSRAISCCTRLGKRRITAFLARNTAGETSTSALPLGTSVARISAGKLSTCSRRTYRKTL